MVPICPSGSWLLHKEGVLCQRFVANGILCLRQPHWPNYFLSLPGIVFEHAARERENVIESLAQPLPSSKKHLLQSDVCTC